MHAAQFWRYVIEIATGIPTMLAAPSVASMYHAATPYRGWLCVSLSQSGQTPEIVAATERVAASGATVLVVTNEMDSPLAKLGHVTWALAGGREVAVPATKTVTAQFAAAFGLVTAFGGSLPVDLGSLGQMAMTVLLDSAPLSNVALRLSTASSLLVTSRGISYASAQEAALKIKETTGIPTEGYSAAELQHGPIAVAGPGVVALTIDCGGPAHQSIEATSRLLDERGTDVVRISMAADSDLSLPVSSEAVGAILAVLRAQQVALSLSRVLGLDADTGVGLSKITHTR